ncbi:MAG: hypothetical protein HYU33_06920, partial [Candidatus Omnitrophica bacterium]|nr:hypothetical protein [Candidatus Omnitrophota bacterium]
MYRPRLKVLLPAVLLLALLAGNEIFRHSAFAFLRFPFRVIRSAVKSLVLLPRLGELAYENQKLQETLLQKQLELAGLKEQMRTSEQARLLTASSDLRGIVALVIGRSLLATQHT